tara:strand:- start:204 stop:983 length:780 start_codon:yes stop_codon:yes gene_type:complete
MLTLDILFQREYFNKLKSKEKLRELADSSLGFGEGRKWAQMYYDKHFQTLDEFKKRKTGLLSSDKAVPIFTSIIGFIKNKQLEENKNVYIIQLGSSSGRDLEFFYKIYPKLNYISTDVNDEILNFQKEKYDYSNFSFFKCHAEDIDRCINHFNIENKILILFSSSSLQYVNPYYLKEFFNKVKKYNNLNFFIGETVSLNFINNSKKMSDSRLDISFSHRYDEYANEAKMKIIEKRIIRPFSKNHPIHKDTGHFYLHLKA